MNKKLNFEFDKARMKENLAWFTFPQFCGLAVMIFAIIFAVRAPIDNLSMLPHDQDAVYYSAKEDFTSFVEPVRLTEEMSLIPNIPLIKPKEVKEIKTLTLKELVKSRKCALNVSDDQIYDYINLYAKVCVKEEKSHKIPAEISMAQGILESKSGTSVLAYKHKNHFGIKCFSRDCSAGHCVNFNDDSHKDFFRKFHSAWDSYAEHSRFLQRRRYAPLKKIPLSDYKGWSKGLKECGYATDPKYDVKLIKLIEDLQLYRLGEPGYLD